jgi:hypothetical protein
MNQSENQTIPEPPASSAVVLPPTLDDQSVQRMLADVATRAPAAPLVMNARNCVFATPYALAALLAVGEDRAVKATFIPRPTPIRPRTGHVRDSFDLRKSCTTSAARCRSFDGPAKAMCWSK